MTHEQIYISLHMLGTAVISIPRKCFSFFKEVLSQIIRNCSPDVLLLCKTFMVGRKYSMARHELIYSPAPFPFLSFQVHSDEFKPQQ